MNLLRRRSSKKTIAPEEIEVGNERFECLRFLGLGAFGRVFLVRHVRTGEQYALKAFRKDNLLDRNRVGVIKLERFILTQAKRNPFIVNLHYAYRVSIA